MRALKEAESNFRHFFETIEDMFIISNLKGDIIHANKTSLDKLEYSLEELRNLNMLDLHPDRKKEETVKLVREMMSNKREYGSLEFQSKSGKIYSVESRIWFGKWNQEDCVYSISKDVTEKIELEKKLQDRLQKLTNIIEGTNLGTWEWNIETGELGSNGKWAEMIGYTMEELRPITPENWSQFVHPDDLEISNKILESHIKDEVNYYDVVIRMKHKDGRWIWIETKGRIIERDESGRPIKMFGTHSDTTVRKEQALELERFFYVNLDLLCIIDIEGRFVKTNKAWVDVLGYSTSELDGHRFVEFVHPDDIEETLEVLNQSQRGDIITYFVNRYINKAGNYRYIEWRSSPYEDKVYAAARDVTERIEHERKILEISNKDALTNVYNRRYIFSRAEEIIGEYQRTENIFSVCIIDIDYFKNINDNYGHQAGDYILKEFTKTISKSLRPYDILGRYGGEEFIIILNKTGKDKSEIIINRILNIIRKKTFVFNNEKINFTFSAGISDSNELDRKNLIIDKLVEIADKRMYQAKETGRNRIISK